MLCLEVLLGSIREVLAVASPGESRSRAALSVHVEIAVVDELDRLAREEAELVEMILREAHELLCTDATEIGLHVANKVEMARRGTPGPNPHCKRSSKLVCTLNVQTPTTCGALAHLFCLCLLPRFWRHQANNKAEERLALRPTRKITTTGMPKEADSGHTPDMKSVAARMKSVS